MNKLLALLLVGIASAGNVWAEPISILFVGNSYTFGRTNPVMSYNAANVTDLTAPMAAANATGSNSFEPHPWGGVAGIFKQFTVQAGLDYNVALSARNAASLRGHYLNSNPANWDLLGNIASQQWDKVVLQEQSDEALPKQPGLASNPAYFNAYASKIEDFIHQGLAHSYRERDLFGGTNAACAALTGASAGSCGTLRNIPANPNASLDTDVYLYQTWARPNLVNAPFTTVTDPVTGAVSYTGTPAPSLYPSLEAMNTDLHNAYFGLAASNSDFAGVAPVGDAFMRAVASGIATGDMYALDAASDGLIDLWWDDGTHASKWGSYLSALTLFGSITGIDPKSLGAGEIAAMDLGISAPDAVALQRIASAQLDFPVAAVPEPSTLVLAMLGLGLAGWLAHTARRRWQGMSGLVMRALVRAWRIWRTWRTWYSLHTWSAAAGVLAATVLLAGCAHTPPEAAPTATACPKDVPGRCLSGKDSAGAYYLIAIPTTWNGHLVLHAHGGPALGAPQAERTAEDLERWAIMVKAGYAWAGSSFRQGGVAVRTAAEDTERLRQIFVQHVGQPKRTVLHGQSWGASVAAKGAEMFNRYDAVLLTSGVLAGGTRSYDFRLDLRVVYQYLCGNHPKPDEAAYPLWMGLPYDGSPSGKLSRAELAARVEDCLGVRKPAAQRSPEQARKLKTIVDVIRIPESSVLAHLSWATWHFQDIAQHRTGGGNAFTNANVRYTGSSDDAALNAGVLRYRADPQAVARFGEDTDLTGRIKVPVLTVHGVGDATAFVELDSAFRETMARAGNTERLVQTFTNDREHSYLSDPVYPTLMAALLQWVERGDKPTPVGIAEHCKSFEARFGASCRFLPDFQPAALDTRVAPRN